MSLLPGSRRRSGPHVARLAANDSYHVVGLRVFSPEFQTRKQAEAWMSEQLALPGAPKVAPRRCLCCETLFESEGVHNRLCDGCANRRNHLGGYAYSGQSDGRRPRALMKG